MKSNTQIRTEAKIALKGNWGQAVLATFVFFAISIAMSGPSAASVNPAIWAASATILMSLFVAGPLSVGFYNSFHSLLVNSDDNLTSNAFNKGFGNYWHVVGGYLLYSLYILLWTCLLIVPGIIMSLAYFAVPYLLVQEPELTPEQAIKKSKAMMKGHKSTLFLMYLGFFCLTILSFITLGIALLWLIPYMYTSLAGFYESVKAEYEGTTVIL